MLQTIEQLFNWGLKMITIDGFEVTLDKFVQQHRITSQSAESLMLVVASLLFEVDIEVRRADVRDDDADDPSRITSEVR